MTEKSVALIHHALDINQLNINSYLLSNLVYTTKPVKEFNTRFTMLNEWLMQSVRVSDLDFIASDAIDAKSKTDYIITPVASPDTIRNRVGAFCKNNIPTDCFAVGSQERDHNRAVKNKLMDMFEAHCQLKEVLNRISVFGDSTVIQKAEMDIIADIIIMNR